MDVVLPDPFTPTTTIAFDLARRQRVELALYDVAGRRVRTLADGFQDAGRHGIVWDGTDDAGFPLASGTYLVRLRADARVHVGKVMLTR